MKGKSAERASFNRENASHCPQCSPRRKLSQKDSSNHSQHSNAVTSSFASHLRVIVLVAMFLSCATSCLGASVAKDECNPSNPASCSFGATCMKEFRSRTPYYRCVCPRINCYARGLLFEPICASDGSEEVLYVNPLCLMLRQCALQKRIQPLCNGRCDSKCKASPSPQIPHDHCPIRDIGLCLNGGFCVHHRPTNTSSCRCPEGFTGERCETKEMLTKSGEDGKDCSKRFEILSIFAIILLSVVLIAILVCLCLRNRKSDAKLWSQCEKDETTPLRESGRSESIESKTLAMQKCMEK